MNDRLLDLDLERFKSENFIFNEEAHTYKLNNRYLTSVTTYLKKFAKPFDSEYWSNKKAQDRLIESDPSINLSESIDQIYETQKIILQEWKDKADLACDLGTEVHLYLEERFKKIEPSRFKYQESNNRRDKFEKLYKEKLHILESVGQEIRIYSETLGLAGTIDALFLRNFILEIWDYKTNGKFTTDESKCYNKLLPPFQNEWENDLNKYSIQLNLYKLMLAEHGILVKTCAIIHLPPDTEVDDSIIETDAKIYRCKNYIPHLEAHFGVTFYSDLLKKENHLQNS